MMIKMMLIVTLKNAGDVDKYYHNTENSVPSEQEICAKPKPLQSLPREPDCSYDPPAAQVRKSVFLI